MPPVPEPIALLMDRAAKLARSPILNEAFRAASDNPRLWQQAVRDPRRFLDARGLEVPEDLIVLFTQHAVGLPGPGYEPFSVSWFDCRTHWVKKKDGPGYESVEVCFGFEIMAVTSPGPIGR
jgi:hypothetical protein